MHLLTHHKEVTKLQHHLCDRSQTCFEVSKDASDRTCWVSVLTTQDVQLLLLDQTSSFQNADFQKKWLLRCLSHLFFEKLLSEVLRQILSQQSDLLRRDHQKSLISWKKSPRIIQCFLIVRQRFTN